ncbi:MAG: aspartate:alanine exchanger family transporter [Rikenellaceae bacterium]
MIIELLNYSYFSLFLIVALGFILGRIQIKGLSLDVSAVIFIALLFGHFGVIIPKELGNFGLVLFIFTIGIQAGPGFFDSFRSKGKTLIIITMLIITSAAITALGAKYLFDIDTASIVGLMAGALTSTPGLAVAIDSTGSSSASIAYGIAYPFGVIGVILFVKLLPKILRVDLQAEANRLEKERRGAYPDLKTCIFRVSNKAAFGKTLIDLRVRSTTGAIVSRVRHGNDILMPKSDMPLEENDYVQAVGSDDALTRLGVLIGAEREEGELPLTNTQVVQSLLITKQSMVNKKLGDLHLQRSFGCTVTRVRRSGIVISPSPDLELKFGDKLMCVGERSALANMARLFGNDEKRLSDTDFFPIAMGIVLGVLFGKLNISFPGFSFSPGLTGGILMSALVLSAIGKTGPILWSMSGPANQLLRQLGLLLFLAEVGTSAGRNLVSTFQDSGMLLFGVGAALTMIPMIIAVLVGYGVFKVSLLDLLGTITGGMTSTPGLAAADSMADSNIPSVAYATVYPIAMVILILFIQFIAAYN